jgi:hypothetical protein
MGCTPLNEEHKLGATEVSEVHKVKQKEFNLDDLRCKGTVCKSVKAMVNSFNELVICQTLHSGTKITTLETDFCYVSEILVC